MTNAARSIGRQAPSRGMRLVPSRGVAHSVLRARPAEKNEKIHCGGGEPSGVVIKGVVIDGNVQTCSAVVDRAITASSGFGQKRNLCTLISIAKTWSQHVKNTCPNNPCSSVH